MGEREKLGNRSDLDHSEASLLLLQVSASQIISESFHPHHRLPGACTKPLNWLPACPLAPKICCSLLKSPCFNYLPLPWEISRQGQIYQRFFNLKLQGPLLPRPPPKTPAGPQALWLMSISIPRLIPRLSRISNCKENLLCPEALTAQIYEELHRRLPEYDNTPEDGL